MDPLLREFASPFERMTEAEASTLLAQTYGIDAIAVHRLDTERDDTFRIATATARYVLKVAHPDDDPLLTNLQTAAMAFAAELEPTLPLQSLVHSLEGDIEATIDHAGRERVARLLTWLDGTPLHEVRATDAQLGLLGTTLGRLTTALSTFDHPAAHREFVWDAAQLPLVRGLLDEYPMSETRDAFALFDERVAPQLAALPRQTIHNDFHQGNVLVNPVTPDSPDFVSGVIDFGDVVHTVRIADLAVALSYLHYPGAHTPSSIDHFVAGYESQVALLDAEREALTGLIAARYAQRILINLHLGRGTPDDRAAAARGAEGVRQALRQLLDTEV
ncbi:MAG: phosphotransferase [Rhodoglobus sp.]